MEDRIQINGVWYKREEEAPVFESAPVVLDVTNYIGKVAESGLYCFKAEKMYKDEINGELYSGVDIEFTDKRILGEWIEDLWDNDTWMRGVLNDDPDALKELRKSVCERGELEFKAFLKTLVNEGWL
jgi:hypothetical protein